MKFAEAFRHMKAGYPVKLPSWGGYWVWDNEKQTILVHCQVKDSDTEKEVLDIRETQRVEYTLYNILSDDWVLAVEENTPIWGGVATFGFGDAIKYMKRGMKVKRLGWNGKTQYIELATNISYKNATGDIVNCEHDSIGSKAIAFVGTSGVQIGWLASQADMLADDWVFAEQEGNAMELKDTVYLMNSDSYQERFKAEYLQTKIRYEKLKAFNNKIEAAEITSYTSMGDEYRKVVEMPEHDCPDFLLRDQEKAMAEYLHILELRAVIEGIEL